MSKTEVKWLDEPEKHDYPAAESYLSLIYDVQTVATFIDRLKQAPMTEFKAKDIFRASKKDRQATRQLRRKPRLVHNSPSNIQHD